MKKLFIILFVLSLISCKESYKDKIIHTSDFIFDSDSSSLFGQIIYFDSYEQTETKFIFFDKQGKFVGESPITTNYAIGRNLNKNETNR